MLNKTVYQLDNHGPIFAYLPQGAQSANKKLPMVLDLNCTTGNPEAEVHTNGWDRIAESENVVVIAPTYDDYVTYGETGYMKQVIDDALNRFPIDPSRIYSVGFSNGGALSGALASTYPTLLAGIAAMGWMIGLNNTNLTIPFLLIQGTREYTHQLGLHSSVMNDEQVALRDLMSANHLTDQRPDYKQTPYFGYRPDKTFVRHPRYHDYDPYGNNPRLQTNKEWQFNQYFKDGYQHPFAELVLVQDAPHIPHDYNAQVAWEFLRHFRRDHSGKISEL